MGLAASFRPRPANPEEATILHDLAADPDWDEHYDCSLAEDAAMMDDDGGPIALAMIDTALMREAIDLGDRDYSEVPF